MGIWRNIVSYFQRESRTGANTFEPRSGSVSLWDYYAGTPLCISTVFRCSKLLSESVANLPVQYLRNRNGIFIDQSGNRLCYLLNVQPDYAISAFDFWRQIVQSLLFDGNAYIVPAYNPASMELDRLALCGRGTVAHDTVNDSYFVCDTVNGIFGTYDESEIIHIKGLTVDNPKVGVSVLTYARLTTDIATAGDKETRNRFVNGGNVRGIISNDRSVTGFGEYQDEQLKNTAVNMDGEFRNGARIVSVPGQVDFQQISLSSTDMQFLESRKFTVREICRFFGVHPSFVFDDTSNNYKSAEQANVAFLSHTLNPLLRNIETELMRKLIAPELYHKYKISFDRRGLYACDLEGMMKYRTQQLQIGTTVNELRQMDNLPPVEGGDVAMVSANLRAITEVGVKPKQPVTEGSKESKKGKDE